MLSVPVAGSVAETPRLPEGAEPGLEYAPFDEDDGPVDCDCPAACYRGHRGYRSAPGAARRDGARVGRPRPSPPPRARPSPQGQALVQQLDLAPSQEEEKERQPPEEPVRAPPAAGAGGARGVPPPAVSAGTLRRICEPALAEPLCP